MELLWVDISAFFQILVKLGLSWELSLVNFFCPEWMLAEMLPIDSLYRVFFEKS